MAVDQVQYRVLVAEINMIDVFENWLKQAVIEDDEE